MEKGWICLHRQIKECDLLWDDKPFSRGQAWIDLLLMANHETKKMYFDSNLVEVQRGQRITSIRKLCEAWGWSNSKVTHFLNVLENEQMIVRKSDTKKTLITIVNYGKYNDIEEKKRHRNDTEATQKRTNNNDNNDNNENNNNPLTGEPGSPAYDFNKNSNLENVRYVLNKKTYEHWEYIKDNQELWSCIKDWMEYKDSRKPKNANHYTNEKSMITLLNKFVDNSKQYGVSEVVSLVNQSISNIYAGIIWENLGKKSSTIRKTDWSKIQ